jgi:hypothetical protein
MDMSTRHINYKDVLGMAPLYMVLLVFVTVANSAVQAMPITGSMGITGQFTSSGGTDLSDASIITLLSATGTSGSDDIGSTVGFGTVGIVNNGSITFNPATAVNNLLTIGGWQIDLGSMWIVDQTADILTLGGIGVLSGNGFEQTDASWSLSANNTGSSYSLTVAVASTPGILSIFIIGIVLIGYKQLASSTSRET